MLHCNMYLAVSQYWLVQRIAAMTTDFQDAGAFGRDLMESGLKSVASLSRGAQAIIDEAADFSRKSYESGSAALEKLVSAKSLEAAFEIQSDYARHSYEGFVAEATKVGGLYADMAKEAYMPFESVIAKSK